MLIIQYKNLERNGDSGSEYNFEIIIHEDSSNIQFLYELSHPGLNATSNGVRFNLYPLKQSLQYINKNLKNTISISYDLIVILLLSYLSFPAS
jgi:hypothetical protein